ncbi:hypothetical protein C7999DRAFT_17313 [Corynascus novoguineensis]|uniref:DUF1857-domain-containing protein n=1 Tax=Corynascus novoguineensis TaxID=1126955 RepID=A0AAN7CLQ3_9PEZI|nr:hypothetical protein C7999DRAFT_17313 [Corynascus novoguineensis]
MVIINLAYTAPINPPGAAPVLNAEQVWMGLQYKVRRADKFVPVITACEVLSESSLENENIADSEQSEPRVVTRRVTFRADRPGFKEGSGDGRSGHDVKEVCKLYAPCRIDFLQEDGSTIGNYVSRGPVGELMMTYVFEWRVPGVQKNSERARDLEEHYSKMAKMAVEGSIETIRKIVKGEVVMD